MGTVAACLKVTLGGMGTTVRASTSTAVPRQPVPWPKTASPTLHAHNPWHEKCRCWPPPQHSKEKVRGPTCAGGGRRCRQQRPRRPHRRPARPGRPGTCPARSARPGSSAPPRAQTAAPAGSMQQVYRRGLAHDETQLLDAAAHLVRAWLGPGQGHSRKAGQRAARPRGQAQGARAVPHGGLQQPRAAAQAALHDIARHAACGVLSALQQAPEACRELTQKGTDPCKVAEVYQCSPQQASSMASRGCSQRPARCGWAPPLQRSAARPMLLHQQPLQHGCCAGVRSQTCRRMC